LALALYVLPITTQLRSSGTAWRRGYRQAWSSNGLALRCNHNSKACSIYHQLTSPDRMYANSVHQLCMITNAFTGSAAAEGKQFSCADHASATSIQSAHTDTPHVRMRTTSWPYLAQSLSWPEPPRIRLPRCRRKETAGMGGTGHDHRLPLLEFLISPCRACEVCHVSFNALYVCW